MNLIDYYQDHCCDQYVNGDGEADGGDADSDDSCQW